MTEALQVQQILDEPGAPVVVFDKVRLAFDENVVLKDLSFTVIKGHTKIILGASGWLTATPITAQVAVLPGTASVTGTVESPVRFNAAQVFIRNVDKRIQHTVFTNAAGFGL